MGFTYDYDYGKSSSSYSGLGDFNASDYTGNYGTGASAASAASGGDWYSAAITAAAGLAQGYFKNRAAKDDAKAAERAAIAERLQELELEKIRAMAAKGGGGGRSRDLDLLEMALGIYDSSSASLGKTYQGAADRYASIYNSAGAGGR